MRLKNTFVRTQNPAIFRLQSTYPNGKLSEKCFAFFPTRTSNSTKVFVDFVFWVFSWHLSWQEFDSLTMNAPHQQKKRILPAAAGEGPHGIGGGRTPLIQYNRLVSKKEARLADVLNSGRHDPDPDGGCRRVRGWWAT